MAKPEQPDPAILAQRMDATQQKGANPLALKLSQAMYLSDVRLVRPREPD